MILLDLFGVLFEEKSFTKKLKKICERENIEIDVKTIKRIGVEVRLNGNIEKLYEIVPHWAWFKALVSLTPREDEIEILRKIKEKIGIATNFYKPFSEFLLDYYDIPFSFLFTPQDLKVFKYRKEFFEKIAERVKGEIIFIDDNEKNVKAAREAGIKAFVYGKEIKSLREVLC